MKRKSLLIMLLVALFVPLAMNAQDMALRKKSRVITPDLEVKSLNRAISSLNVQNGPVQTSNLQTRNLNTMASSNATSGRGTRATQYELVTSELTDWSGNYILGIDNGSTVLAFDGDLYGASTYGYQVGGLTSVAQTSSSSGVISDAGDAAILTFTRYQSYDLYTIKVNDQNYLGSDSITGLKASSSLSSVDYLWEVIWYSGNPILFSLADNNDCYGITFFVETESGGSQYYGFSNYELSYSGSTFGYYYTGLYKETTVVAPDCNSITFSDVCTNQQNVNGSSFQIGDASSVSFAKNSGSTNPTYYTSGASVRVYPKNSFTVTSTSNILSINLTFGSGDYTNTITASTGTYSNGAWTGEATSVTFTVGGTKNHRRIAAIEVCVEADHTCDAPTELSSADVTENSAALSWTGNADAYNIQYHVVDPTAPATVILNIPTDIWGDGTGYQFILDADHNTYGSTIPETASFTAGTFADFEYTIPEDAECNASTNTIIVSGSATITVPAGIYDYAFLNPDPSSGTYYIASNYGTFPGRGDDFEFEAGKTYEFTVYSTVQSSYTYDAISLTTTVDWTSVPGTVTSPYTLTGLDPETTYEWQVKGDGCENWSAIASFTTLEETSMPVQFTVNAPETAHPGDVITVEAVLTAPENYSGFTDLLMAINYDHTAFAFVNGSIVYGPVIAQAQQYNAQVTNITNVTDKIQVAINCFDEGYFVTADGIVFSAQFTVLEGAEGEYTFTAEPNGAANFDHEGVAISYEATPSTVVVADEHYYKDITGWSTGGALNFYLIASPLMEAVAPTDVHIYGADANTNMVSGSFDLYYFDHAEANEWVNYKPGTGATNPEFSLEPGKGYLYANYNTVRLDFAGTGRTSGEFTVDLDYVSGTGIDLPGWNLVGNPFTENAWLVGNRSFYTMDVATGEFIGVTGDAINPMEGVFVVATDENESVTFTTTEQAKSSKLALNLSNGRRVVDRAIVRFDGGDQLPKLQFRQGSTKVYIPVEGQDYAVVSCEEMGELPVSFKAEENGSYNLSLSSEEVSFAYLHLIDNLTGADVDLLQTPSYSFEAKTTDYESRFKLVFATGDNSNDDNFAFFSNGSFVINNDGEATLQVIDVTGRILSSESINGCTNVNVNAASGVYMLRLINGDNVKVQKVVVK